MMAPAALHGAILLPLGTGITLEHTLLDRKSMVLFLLTPLIWKG